MHSQRVPGRNMGSSLRTSICTSPIDWSLHEAIRVTRDLMPLGDLPGSIAYSWVVVESSVSIWRPTPSMEWARAFEMLSPLAVENHLKSANSELTFLNLWEI